MGRQSGEAGFQGLADTGKESGTCEPGEVTEGGATQPRFVRGCGRPGC